MVRLLLDEPRQLRLADEGCIVITNGSQATIQKVDAQCISTTNFRLKVNIDESNKEVTCGSTASPAPPTSSQGRNDARCAGAR